MPPIPPMPPMPPIPPGIPAGAASFSSGLSAIIASVVTNNPEIDGLLEIKNILFLNEKFIIQYKKNF